MILTDHKSNMETKVFCGGRFHFDYLDEDYIQKASEDYRALLLGDVNKLLRGSGLIRISDHLSYVGPYYFETEGMIDRDIVVTEMRMIENCDVTFFLLDDGTCPGTISEMNYAAALQKRMCIVYLKDEEETESSLRAACWYPINMCRMSNKSETEIISCSDFEEAQRIILKKVLSA